MPLTVVAATLLSPTGELDPALFPMETAQALTDRLDGYLAAGYAAGQAAGVVDDARLNRMATAYAYWKAYAAVVARILANPTTGNLNDGGSYAYSSEQLRQLVAERDRWRAEYETELPVDDVGAVKAPQETAATPNVFVW